MNKFHGCLEAMLANGVPGGRLGCAEDGGRTQQSISVANVLLENNLVCRKELGQSVSLGWHLDLGRYPYLKRQSTNTELLIQSIPTLGNGKWRSRRVQKRDGLYYGISRRMESIKASGLRGRLRQGLVWGWATVLPAELGVVEREMG